MFTKDGIKELHAATHERLDTLLDHVATVPDPLLREPLPGFGFPTVWLQLIHMLTCEEGWVYDLQAKLFHGWYEKDCPTLDAMRAAKTRICINTRRYVDGLSEEQFNAVLAHRPDGWFGALRSPAFVLLHVITHTFHHKGQVVAMLRSLGHPAPDTDLQSPE